MSYEVTFLVWCEGYFPHRHKEQLPYTFIAKCENVADAIKEAVKKGYMLGKPIRIRTKREEADK